MVNAFARPYESRIQDVLTTAYDNTVTDTDAFFDRLTTDLGSDDEDPLLVVHADHGEELGEQGSYGHGSLSDEVLHVPMIVGNGPDDTVTEPFSLSDMNKLLEALATDHDYRDCLSPVAKSRTFNSKSLHGRSWKCIRSDGEDRLVGVDDPSDAERTDALRSLSESVFDHWEDANEERKSVQEAVASLSEAALL